MSHDNSEIILICWFAAQETFLSMLKSVVLLHIFVETTIYFFQAFLLNRKHLFERETFYNIINTFTVTFDQINASLLNKSKKQKTWLQTVVCTYSWSQKLTYTLQNLQNVNYFKIRGIIQNACYYLVLTWIRSRSIKFT